MEIKIENESVTTDFKQLKKCMPAYNDIDTHDIYNDIGEETLQYLKIALEDVNQLWKELEFDKKIINAIQEYDRYYGDIEDMCKHAKLAQSVRLNVECSIMNINKILKKESE